MVGKNDFTSKIIFLYSLQRDKTLSTFKKEVKNGGTSISLIPKKISLKYTQSKPMVKSISVKIFLIKEIWL
jgi:hypothetical protein